MSREVRRVPLDWKHPVEHNPHWEFQQSTPYGRSKPASRLHGPTERFVSLLDDYLQQVADHARERADLEARTGNDWAWRVGYHLTGWTDHEGNDRSPVGVGDDNGEHRIDVRDEYHLQQLLLAQHARQAPLERDYMPVFNQPTDTLGWCLYETVSEGTPVTPVFATADDLIDHLVAHGIDWHQTPWPRESAESVVQRGYTFGTFVATEGELLRSDIDAAQIDALHSQDR